MNRIGGCCNVAAVGGYWLETEVVLYGGGVPAYSR